jgi:hypothetical protein
VRVVKHAEGGIDDKQTKADEDCERLDPPKVAAMSRSQSGGLTVQSEVGHIGVLMDDPNAI